MAAAQGRVSRTELRRCVRRPTRSLSQWIAALPDAGVEADGGPAQLEGLVNHENAFSPTNTKTIGYTMNTADGINHKNRFHIRNVFDAENLTDCRNAVS